MDKEDNKSVEDFLAGDEAAFEKLLQKYLKPVFNFLCQLVRDRNIAEDLAQETFVKVWKNMRRFDSDKKFKTWVFAIAKNTAFDFFKKKKTIPFSVFADEDGNNPLEEINGDDSPAGELPDEILMKKDLTRELDEKLEQIPEKYKIILLMRYKEDFSLGEISEILGKPYNTIKSSHSRALFQLKKVFMEDNASE